MSENQNELLLISSLSVYPHGKEASYDHPNNDKGHKKNATEKLRQLKAELPRLMDGIYEPTYSPSHRSVEGGPWAAHLLLLVEGRFYLFFVEGDNLEPTLLQAGNIKRRNGLSVYGEAVNSIDYPSRWDFSFHPRMPNPLEKRSFPKMKERLLEEVNKTKTA